MESWVEQLNDPGGKPQSDELLAYLWQAEDPEKSHKAENPEIPEKSEKLVPLSEIEKADQNMADKWRRFNLYSLSDEVVDYIKSVNDALKLRKLETTTKLLPEEINTAEELFPEEQLAQDLYSLELNSAISLSDELKRASFISKLTGQWPTATDARDEFGNAVIIELARQKGNSVSRDGLNLLNWTISHNPILKNAFSLAGKNGEKALYEDDDYADIADKLVVSVADAKRLHQKYIDACRDCPTEPKELKRTAWDARVSQSVKRTERLWQKVQTNPLDKELIKEFMGFVDDEISWRKEAAMSGKACNRAVDQERMAQEELAAKEKYPHSTRASDLYFLEQVIPGSLGHALKSVCRACTKAAEDCAKASKVDDDGQFLTQAISKQACCDLVDDLYNQGRPATAEEKTFLNNILSYWVERMPDGKGGFIGREHHEGPDNKDKFVIEGVLAANQGLAHKAPRADTPNQFQAPYRLVDRNYDIYSVGEGFTIKNLQDGTEIDIKCDPSALSYTFTKDPADTKLNCRIEDGKISWFSSAALGNQGISIEHHLSNCNEIIEAHPPIFTKTLKFSGVGSEFIADQFGNRVNVSRGNGSTDSLRVNIDYLKGRSYQFHEGQLDTFAIEGRTQYRLVQNKDGNYAIHMHNNSSSSVRAERVFDVPKGAKVITWDDATFRLIKDGITTTIFPNHAVETIGRDGVKTLIQEDKVIEEKYLKAIQDSLNSIRKPLVDLVQQRGFKWLLVNNMADYIDATFSTNGQAVKKASQERPRGYSKDGTYEHARGLMDGNLVVAERAKFGNEWLWLPLKEVAEVVKHEFGHALDVAMALPGQSRFTESQDFIDKHEADIAQLKEKYRDSPGMLDRFQYFWQKDPVTGAINPANGRSETFAEIVSILLSEGDTSREFIAEAFPNVKALVKGRLDKICEAAANRR